MQNIVITGANGFTGSHILEDFKAHKKLLDFNIIAACRSSSKLPHWYKGAFLEGDLLEQHYLEKLTKNTDVICHTAAWAELNGSDENSKKYFYKPTIALIDTALKNGVKRFIFLSAIPSKPITKGIIHSNRSLEKIWPHYDSIIKIEKHLEMVSEQGMEVIILRAGFFTGKNYALGLLPVLLPRLKTHLVPWINKGQTSLPLIDGRDLGQAFRLASLTKLDRSLNHIDVVGKAIPTVREVFNYLHQKHAYPLPHFNVSFRFAYGFARFVQLVHKILPGDPLIVPSIVLLLEETNANNEKAKEILNYKPRIHWKESIDMQLSEMEVRQVTNMRLNKGK